MGNWFSTFVGNNFKVVTPEDTSPPVSCEFYDGEGFCLVTGAICPHFESTFQNCVVRQSGMSKVQMGDRIDKEALLKDRDKDRQTDQDSALNAEDEVKDQHDHDDPEEVEDEEADPEEVEDDEEEPEGKGKIPEKGDGNPEKTTKGDEEGSDMDKEKKAKKDKKKPFESIIENRESEIRFDQGAFRQASAYHPEAEKALANGDDDAFEDDNGFYFERRKKGEIINLLLRTTVNGERIRNTDFKNWEDEELDYEEEPIMSNHEGEQGMLYRLADGSGVLFTFGFDGGDRWGVMTAVGRIDRKNNESINEGPVGKFAWNYIGKPALGAIAAGAASWAIDKGLGYADKKLGYADDDGEESEPEPEKKPEPKKKDKKPSKEPKKGSGDFEKDHPRDDDGEFTKKESFRGIVEE